MEKRIVPIPKNSQFQFVGELDDGGKLPDKSQFYRKFSANFIDFEVRVGYNGGIFV